MPRHAEECLPVCDNWMCRCQCHSRNRTPKPDDTCQWFLLCNNGAVGTLAHPILGDVPVCQRCADKNTALGGTQELKRFEEENA